MENTDFLDLPADFYPFTMQGFDVDTKEILWSFEVTDVGIIHIPDKPESVRQVGIAIIKDNNVFDFVMPIEEKEENAEGRQEEQRQQRDTQPEAVSHREPPNGEQDPPH